MSTGMREVLDEVRRELALGDRENRLVAAVAAGEAPREVLGGLAVQQYRIIASDRRSMLILAARCADNPAGGYFAGLAAGESTALRALDEFSRRCGLTPEEAKARAPLAGCQAYPAYLAWLALNADPAGVVLALSANFAAWGAYCGTVAEGLRRHYGFDDAACAFFDFFAEPDPTADDAAVAVLEALTPDAAAIEQAREYGGMLQSYELMFWNTLADHDSDRNADRSPDRPNP
ncbi:hypothetical protein GCM10010441_59490 [Kitasatospora paracochleata]|uniref:Thiaminase-2/PQQC domain-containing protein n=1 Tax=Kitasatospora paracochleata TaxID=58354 RepID=A0ABT1J1C8_9ACTN|nr:transcriptional regulator [Kitasatospora paracochleata]MCP2311212.1 hypothetical protein [Kitasatospora paracochleata]